MNTLSCTQVAELADELALDALSGDERALALGHLEGCPACRALVDELSLAADELFFACPAVDPPVGFEDRVMAGVEALRHQRQPWWRHRGVVLVAAAAAAVALIAGAGPTLHGGAAHHTGLAVSGTAPRTAKLVSAEGQVIGDVAASAGPPAWFFMRVDQGTDTETYRCLLDLDGGRTLAIGTMVVTDGKGSWGDHVSVDAHAVRAAQLVDRQGHIIATAVFSA